MKKELVIFHFLPLELFPPVLNILNYFIDNNKDLFSITVVTTYPDKGLQLFENENVTIVRYKNIDASSASLLKILRYFHIYLGTLYHLFKLRPKVVFYIETLSSLAPLIYKWIYRKTHVYIHYHEIVTLDELSQGRTLNKWLNRLERKCYNKASWISQTNIDRLNVFAKEQGLTIDSKMLRTLPNYPPSKWANLKRDTTHKKDKIQLLHIGALSLESMFLNELLETFGDSDQFDIHFYSHTTNKVIIDKLSGYENVTFKGRLNYNDIPKLKGLYDVGLVLYKGGSINVEYCAPNKIFEYLALDLDVWCSDKLITAKEYQNQLTYPKMLMVDFEKLAFFNVEKGLSKDGLSYKISPYFCDIIYEPLLDQVHEDFNT